MTNDEKGREAQVVAKKMFTPELQKEIKDKLNAALGGEAGVRALAEQCRTTGYMDKETAAKIIEAVKSVALPAGAIAIDIGISQPQSSGIVQPPEPGQNPLPGNFGNVKIGNFKPPGSEHRN